MRRVPAEWETQRAIWLAWPHNPATWPGHFEPIGDFFRHLIKTLANKIPVRVIGASELRGVADLEDGLNVTWHDIPTNDAWIRDYGPTYLSDLEGPPAAIDWRYNSWGGKYPPWQDDDAATARIIQATGRTRIDGQLCLEGGALEWDGRGRLLTTTSCLVTATRNPKLEKAQIETRLRDIAGATEIVWVDGGGLVGDDTDGHIDQLARFVDRQNVVVAVCDDPRDANHRGLERNFEMLTRWAEGTTPSVNLHRLPIPPARSINDQRVPESYCNFLRVDDRQILIPTFGHASTDSHAMDLLGQLARRQSPDIEVINIDCRDLIWGLGALHCASSNEFAEGPMSPTDHSFAPLG